MITLSYKDNDDFGFDIDLFRLRVSWRGGGLENFTLVCIRPLGKSERHFLRNQLLWVSKQLLRAGLGREKKFLSAGKNRTISTEFGLWPEIVKISLNFCRFHLWKNALGQDSFVANFAPSDVGRRRLPPPLVLFGRAAPSGFGQPLGPGAGWNHRDPEAAAVPDAQYDGHWFQIHLQRGP